MQNRTATLDWRAEAGIGHYLACAALLLLVAFLPLSRAIEFILMPESAATLAARIHIGVIELLFIAGVLADPRTRLPRLQALPRWVPWIGGAWLLWGTLTALLATYVGTAFIRQGEWLLHGAAAAALWAFLRAHPGWRAHLPRAMLLGFLVYAVGITFFLRQVQDPHDFPWLQAMLGFRNIRHFSAYAAMALLAALQPLLAQKRPEPRELAGIAAVMTVPWAFLFWSGGRGAFLAVAVTLVGLTVLRLLPRPKLCWTVILASAVAGLLVSIPFTPPNGSFGVFRLAGDLVAADDLQSFSSSRLDMWRQALGMIGDHPLIGLGPDNYAHTPRDPFGAFEHPHNALLQAALDWGLPGMALAVSGGLGLTVLSALRNVLEVRDAAATVGFAVAIMLLALSLVSSPMYYGFPLMTCLFALASALPLSPARR